MLTSCVLIDLESVQLYTWSDEHTKGIRCRTAKTSQCSCAPTASAQIDSAGIHHRAIQALWQAGMQMRRRARSWSQVLSVSELSRPASTDGLCAAGGLRRDGGIDRQLSPNARNSGDNLRDQPRIVAPSRGALKRHHERVTARSSRSDRCAIGRRASRQYARRLAQRGPKEYVFCGGSL
jgi:hypothetical protein